MIVCNVGQPMTNDAVAQNSVEVNMQHEDLSHLNYEMIPGEPKGLTDMACCKRLVGGDHLYIYPRKQHKRTTLKRFCRKCTRSENLRWPPQMPCIYNF